ncbi:hypothetical protein QQF64_029192 [Cirrhinus molitorella]|uniref:Uncharacterized protein n=1 Tax=Cirrhinus molitorella TaxID=172907 RepID=A0ABR3N8S6_9TELE
MEKMCFMAPSPLLRAHLQRWCTSNSTIGTLTRARTELNPDYLDLRSRAELNPEYWTPCTPLLLFSPQDRGWKSCQQYTSEHVNKWSFERNVGHMPGRAPGACTHGSQAERNHGIDYKVIPGLCDPHSWCFPLTCPGIFMKLS